MIQGGGSQGPETKQNITTEDRTLTFISWLKLTLKLELPVDFEPSSNQELRKSKQNYSIFQHKRRMKTDGPRASPLHGSSAVR